MKSWTQKQRLSVVPAKCRNGGKMPSNAMEQKALRLLNVFEKAGKTVSSVIVEGKRIELRIQPREDSDEFDRIDMRHGKT